MNEEQGDRSARPPARRLVAGLFPGQAHMTPEMGEWVAAVRPDLYEHACELAGEDPFRSSGRAAALVGPAVYCASLTAWAHAGDVRVLGGHSVGEFAALAAAGALDEHDGLELVALRGRLADEVCAEHPGGMIAVHGPRAHWVAQRLAAASGLVVAHDDSPGRMVLSGPTMGIERAMELAQEWQVDAARLAVIGALHSPLMAPMVPAFRRALADVTFVRPQMLVVSGVTARPFTDPADQLARAITVRVRWRATVLALASFGTQHWVEVGPGHALTGLVRGTLPEADTRTLDPAEAEEAHA